jgi:hypothetical protein
VTRIVGSKRRRVEGSKGRRADYKLAIFGTYLGFRERGWMVGRARFRLSADSHPDKTQVISGTCISTAIGCLRKYRGDANGKIREALERSNAIAARHGPVTKSAKHMDDYGK